MQSRRIRRLTSSLSVMATLGALALFFFSGAAFADLDKEKVKEKEEKDVRPVLDGDEHAVEHNNLIKMGEENLKEINRLLDEIQKDLAQKNTGSATQERQAKAVKRMEELIKELGKG